MIKKNEEKKIGFSEELLDAVVKILDDFDTPTSISDDLPVWQTALDTRSLLLNLILGGGFHKGCWTTIYGPESSGKTSIIYNSFPACQKAGTLIILLDPEGSFHRPYISRMGFNFSLPYRDPVTNERIKVPKKHRKYFGMMDTEEYLPALIRPPLDIGEDMYKFMAFWMDNLEVDVERKYMHPRILFVIDSIAGMNPKAMNDGSERVGLVADMHSKYIRGIISKLSKKECSIVATNQIRLSPLAYGDPEVESGGQATKFYPQVKIRCEREVKSLRSQKQVITEGKHEFFNVEIKTIKNKRFPSHREGALRIRLGFGIDPIMDTYKFLEETGQLIIPKDGRGKWQIKSDYIPKEFQKDFKWSECALLKNPDLRQICFDMLRNGEAFKLYIPEFFEEGIEIKDKVETEEVKEESEKIIQETENA